MATALDHRPAEHHRHTHGPGCGHHAVIHGDHVDYVHAGHVHREHRTDEGVHYDECTQCQCEHCSDACALCNCDGCTCPTCNHARCACPHCSSSCSCGSCACDDCTCPTCQHAA